MLHIYRQVRSLRAFRPIVFCQKRENEPAFPFSSVVRLKKPLTHPLRRFWQKQVLRQPITIYHSEARRLVRELDSVNARLIHIYFGHIGVHLLPFIRISRIPVVVSFHGADAQVGLDRGSMRDAMAEMLDRVGMVLVRSKSLGERLETLGCAPAKIRLHRTGLPLDETSSEIRRPPADGAWRCIQAARLIPKKGLFTTLAAFALFHREHPASTLTLAGAGPLLEELQSRARDLGLAQAVTFTGFLPQSELRSLFASSHLFLHPSKLGPDGDQEGVPNSMLEAMASGLPVLATPHGGIPEAVEDGATGLLSPERDAEALARNLLSLVSDPVKYSQMSAAAAESVRRNFDSETQGRLLESYYDELLPREPRP